MSDVRFARACSAAFLRAFVFLVALAICKTLAHEPRKNHAGVRSVVTDAVCLCSKLKPQIESFSLMQ
jgi:hypothetical protein